MDLVKALKSEHSQLLVKIRGVEKALEALSEGSKGKSTRKKRTMSAAARRRIGKAKREWWAKERAKKAKNKKGD